MFLSAKKGVFAKDTSYKSIFGMIDINTVGSAKSCDTVTSINGFSPSPAIDQVTPSATSTSKPVS